jgi:ubiquitin-conjugating enzyme E2 O
VSGPWLGQVSEVRVDADMSFEDGALCTVADAESKSRMLELLTADGVFLLQKNSFFCPGQRVRSCCSSVFKDATWLRGQWNTDRDVAVATVVKVEMSGVLVHWIASRHCGTDPLLLEALAPPAYQNPHDLTFFWVAYNNMGWGPADHCFFTDPSLKHGGSDSAHDRQLTEKECSGDEDMTDDHHEAHNTDEEVPELPSGKCHLQGGHMELHMAVAKTQTYVDVLWQDGTRQSGIPSESIAPFNITNDHEFLPGDHVLDNAASLDGATASTINDDDTASDVTKPARCAGIVRTVCCKDQTVNVSWFKVAACPNEAREVECNDTVSTYSLERESGDSPNLGCIVVRLLPSSWSEMKKNVSPADLSWVGHVIDHPDGHVQVKWGDGSISTVRLLYAYIVLDILILGSLELTDFSKTRGECENILEFSAQLHINEK